MGKFASFISKTIELLLSIFFLPNIFFVWPQRVNNANKEGVTVLVSSQNNSKGIIFASRSFCARALG